MVGARDVGASVGARVAVESAVLGLGAAVRRSVGIGNGVSYVSYALFCLALCRPKVCRNRMGMAICLEAVVTT